MRLLLTAETGSLTGQRFLLERGTLELGRDASCNVRFGPDESQVSRRHAVISRESDGFLLVDHSSNGTLVNGSRIQSVLLRAGDVVLLGADGVRLQVEIETAVAARGMSIVVVLGMMLAGSFLCLLTVLLMFYQMGIGAALVGVIVAFVPAPVYLAIWLWLDRYDPEPAWMLATAFVWGAGAATFVAGIINSVFEATLLAFTNDKVVSELLSASISAPVAEELLKGVGVLAVFLFLRREFDGVLDGIVYAGVVALGFATVENVLYYGKAMATKGPGLLVLVFILRGILGPFSHAVFTSMTGIGCGIARQTHNRTLRLVMPVVGYAGAVTLHALWNTLAAVSGTLAAHLAIYVVVWAPLFLAFFAVVIYMGYRESRLIQRMLALELARGLLQPEHVALAGSWLRRIRWLLSDLSRLGPRRQFLHAVTRLALCYWHASRAEAAGGQTISFAQLPLFQNEIRTLLPRI
jgi:RsiW-degrading membrane proteinase PrsW (M82 family)